MKAASRIAAWVLLASCGARAASATHDAPQAREAPVCTDTVPSGEAECTARGCAWGAPMRCSGVPPRADEPAPSVARRCTCICQQDVERCVRAP